MTKKSSSLIEGTEGSSASCKVLSAPSTALQPASQSDHSTVNAGHSCTAALCGCLELNFH